MQRILSLFVVSVLPLLVLSSCIKGDKPYPLPATPDGGAFPIQNKQVRIGEDYETQVYFSLTNGVVASGDYKDWDINFTMGAADPELRMNGGKMVLIYPTGNTSYASVTSLGTIPATAWKYDNPGGLPGTSGLGILSSTNHIGEVLIVDDGAKHYYKLQITDITATAYKLKAGPLADAAGSDITLDKDDNYNFAYYSFSKGIVKPEPPKTDWDILFTRYRHVYYKYNPDGSDFLYLVNGVLSNPYKTLCGKDSTKSFDFYNFSIDDAKSYSLLPDRDAIGFGWKAVDINTGDYTVKPKEIFVIRDKDEYLWKLHFTGFYDSDGKRGAPSFEYQRMK